MGRGLGFRFGFILSRWLHLILLGIGHGRSPQKQSEGCGTDKRVEFHSFLHHGRIWWYADPDFFYLVKQVTNWLC